jgi:CMP-N-acetylneuraminic acid synthetase
MKIIIPARLGSKGLPFKNRKLIQHTLSIIPEDKIDSCWISTDDHVISEIATVQGFNFIRRPDELASDTASIRDVLVHAIDHIRIKKDELVLMLYLTYPERTWEDVEGAIDFFFNYYQDGLSDSMLCKKEIATHPYLCMQEHGVNGIFGKQIVSHDLYRRQDYPKCFEISHYISIFKAGSIAKLNQNLYCDSTVFYPIRQVIDVDTQKEFEEFHGK